MGLPGAIVFVSNNVTDQVRDTIIKQLFITTTLDGYSYDSLVESDSSYPQTMRNHLERVMVIRSLDELANRETADVVLHIKHGMAAVEKNKFGPPGNTYRIAELYWGKLEVY